MSVCSSLCIFSRKPGFLLAPCLWPPGGRRGHETRFAKWWAGAWSTTFSSSSAKRQCPRWQPCRLGHGVRTRERDPAHLRRMRVEYDKCISLFGVTELWWLSWAPLTSPVLTDKARYGFSPHILLRHHLVKVKLAFCFSGFHIQPTVDRKYPHKKKFQKADP